MNPRSIRFRLTAWFAGILALILAVVGVGVLYALRHAINETIDKDLRSRLSAVQTYLEKHGQTELAEELGEQAEAAPGGAWMRLADLEGKWVYRSPETLDWNLVVPAASTIVRRGRVSAVMVKGHSMRVLSAPVKVGLVQIGIPSDEFDEMLSGFTVSVVLASPLLLLLASLGGYWMSGQALKPVDQIARIAQRISGQNLSERLAVRGTGDELDRLSSTLNEMLVRLEGAFSRIARFTADASHELRTPIAIIRTTAEVTTARPRTPQEHEKAWAQVIIQTEQTSQLINDLLLLTRADAGQDDLSFETIDLAEILQAATDEIEILAQASGVHLKACIPAVCSATGDPDALRRLLLILLDNAIKYTAAGGSIFVDMHLDNSTGESLAVIQVRDTGAGIAQEHLPHIFDRFYRTSQDRSRRNGGAGLGLSIAQWVASRHGGKILVQSVLGTGSTFRLILRRSV